MSAQEKLDEAKKKIEGFAALMQTMIKPMMDLFVFLLPHVIQLVKTINAIWVKLPQNALLFIYGSVFCFFGGTFPVLFAAIQAAEYGGRKAVVQAVKDLANEAVIIIEESKKDDDVDADGDGVKDVKQISGQEYLTRKTLLVLKKINPEKVDKAISVMYKVWLSVAAVLSVQFARVISMSLAIADFLQRPCNRYLAPLIEKITPDDYDKWVPVILSWITKSIAMSLAWYIQSIVSGAASALKGGLMMAQAIFFFCVHRKWTLFGLIPENPDDSYLDEILSYIFAALGFYMQFESNFSLEFPFNVLLFPLSLGEYYIRYAISFKET